MAQRWNQPHVDDTLHPVCPQLFELRIIPELSLFNPTEAPEAYSVGGKKNKEGALQIVWMQDGEDGQQAAMVGVGERGGSAWRWGTFLITSAVFLFAQPLPSCSGMRPVLRPAINGGEHLYKKSTNCSRQRQPGAPLHPTQRPRSHKRLRIYYFVAGKQPAKAPRGLR